ncbi:LamG-like jellyroll fold domain-containing protein [Streptomyces sp. NPDC048567]|uniref:LamG-like jellyroll fold domain-containing protein n=1 Tax=Streptomyces sp. NPDC048567 TaxID=3365570 RepID=UPI0037139927
MRWHVPRAQRGHRGWGGRRLATALLATAITVGVQSQGLATPSAAAEPTARTEAQEALAQAEETGQRVEIVGRRTPYETTYANPDGYSFHLVDSAVPVRVPQEGGGWQHPDDTLERRADGSVAPKAAAVDMAFSGGGDGSALVRIADQGRSLSLGWPGKLPAPTLDGATALYADVLPDVDLQMTATVEGYRQVLVVKTPEAAADPELKKIDYALKATGLTLRKQSGGGLAAVDEQGRALFRAPRAQMWNSAGDDESTATAVTAKSRAVPAPADGATSEGDPSDGGGLDRSQQPAHDDDVAVMDTQVTGTSLSVVPDSGLIRATTADQYPIYIDPTVTWGESERTLLRSDGYESYGWGNGSDGQGVGVGHCGTWSGYYCGNGYTQKLYFEFSPASLKGKQILDATFRATETWSFTCDARWVDLVRTNNISSSTTWSSRPKELDWMVDRYVAAGRGSACSPSQPSAPIEFNDNPEETNENLTPTVKDFAAGKFSRLTLELRAHDESDTSAWKRFKNDAVLAVDYVGLPAKPSGIGLNVGNKPVCETSASDPQIVSDPTPNLMATAQTASGGESGAQLRVYFDIDRQDGDGTWLDSPAGNGDLRPSSGYVGDNAALNMNWPSLAEGSLYRYRAWVRSYYNGGADYLSGPSNGSTTGWCYFRVDAERPHAPKVSIGSPYTECTANACDPHGGPGEAASFTFTPDSADSDVTGYEYRLEPDGEWTSAGSGTKATVSVTPDTAGTKRIAVRAKDSTGPGAQNLLDFLVAAGDGPVGRWHFAESDGAAADSGTAAGSARHHATLTGGATRDDRGRRGVLNRDASGTPLDTPVTDRGLALDGSTGYAATDGPVVDTRASYTVSAWAKVDAGATGNRTVLGQNGDFYSGFYLSYMESQGTWTLRTSPTDAADGNISEQMVVAKQPASFGVWTHLAASYDAKAKEIRLYVNGKLQGTHAVAPSWQASGPLEIGRAYWRGSFGDYFPGSIDEVSAWQRALSDGEIADDAALATSDGFNGAELMAAWDPATGTGTTVPDTASGYGHALVLTGGASLRDGAIVLDGTDGAATSAGPLVDDTGSFTVTAAVSLDGAALAARPVGTVGQVLGQRTADGSAWGLWYEVTGKDTVVDEETFEEKTVPVGIWHFGRLNSDGTFSSVTSDATAELDSPVRLTGVFDAQAGTIGLYLGHNRNGADTAFTAKAGQGDFALGKAFDSGSWGHYLPASLSDVRLWAGAMASSAQIDEAVGD